MSKSMKLESAEKLCDAIKKVYTFHSTYTNAPFRYTGEKCEYSFDEENENILNIMLTVRVDEVKYKLTGEKRVNSLGQTWDEVDWNTFKVVDTEKHYLEFSVDLGQFNVIEDNGKRKTAINAASHRTILKFFKDSIRISCWNPNWNRFSGAIYIKVFERDSKDKRVHCEGNVELEKNTILNLSQLLSYYGLYNDYKDYIEKSDEELDENLAEKIKEYKIDPKTISKLKIVSKGKFNDNPEYLNKNLLKFLLDEFLVDADQHYELDTMYSHRRHCDMYNVPTPLDYVFMNGIDGLIRSIQESTRAIQAKTNFDYKRMVSDKSNTSLKVLARNITSTAIQNTINKYYHMQEDDYHEVQSAKDSNTLTLMSQAGTVYFYEKQQDGTIDKSRVYSKYFLGVLDPVRTRDSNLINKNNEFALCTRIENNEILITVKDILTGKDVELDYATFNLTPILASNCYDENTREIITDHGVYSILQYSDYVNIETKEELNRKFPDLKYVRKYENMLCHATKMIPYANFMVSTRTSMGSHFIDQSIPVDGSKPPLVYTGEGKEIYESNPDNEKYDEDEPGTVIDTHNQYVKIKTKSGKIKVYGKDQRFRQSSVKTTTEYVPQVHIGQKVRKDDILITSNSFTDGEFTTFVPTYVAFGTYKGHEHEDGIILTESAAKKFTHLIDFEVSRSFRTNKFYSFKRNDGKDTKEVIAKKKLVKRTNPVTKKSKLVEIIPYSELEKQDKKDRHYNLNEWSLVKPGSFVSAGSLLFEFYEWDVGSIKSDYGKLFGNQIYDNEKIMITRQIRVPYDVRKNGIVEEVRLVINGTEELFDTGLIYDEEQLKKATKVSDLQKVKDTEQTLPGTFGIRADDNREAYRFFKKLDKDQYLDNLEFKEERNKRGKYSWKVENEDSAFELYVVIRYPNELTDKRLGAKLSNMYGSKGVNVFLIPDEYAPYDRFNNKIEGFISTGTSFSRQNPAQIYECQLGLIGLETWKFIKDKTPTNPKVKHLLNKLYPNGWDWNQLQKDGKKYGYCRIQVKPVNEKYYVKNLIDDLLEELNLNGGKSRLFLPEYDTWSETECTVGVVSLMRLHFLQEEKMGVTGVMSKETDDDNLTYRELDRPGGQKIGQMESVASLANGTREVLESCAVNSGDVSKGAKYSAAAIMLNLKIK